MSTCEKIRRDRIHVIYVVAIASIPFYMSYYSTVIQVGLMVLLPYWIIIIYLSIFLSSKKIYYDRRSKDGVLVDTILGRRIIFTEQIKKVVSTSSLSGANRMILMKTMGFPFNNYLIMNPEKFFKESESTQNVEIPLLKTTEISSYMYILWRIYPIIFVLLIYCFIRVLLILM